jgi:hypothetical protein
MASAADEVSCMENLISNPNIKAVNRFRPKTRVSLLRSFESVIKPLLLLNELKPNKITDSKHTDTSTELSV